ncbi:MAG: DUF1207 domain-containing protein, partial [Planctomycetes bacterium]|nr:DUF1207 domain-containing protein [Planctomycetota bacterium]
SLNGVTPVGFLTQDNASDDSMIDPSLNPIHGDPTYAEGEGISSDYEWQLLPIGTMYRAYIAGEKESRIHATWLRDKNRLVWETALGGRFAFVRHGTNDPINPEGWQLDFEGAALPRVIPDDPSSPLEAVDFRIGLLSTWKRDKNAFKAGYYHLSSHVGDEFLISNPGFVRKNYVRDSLIAGWTRDLFFDTQIYGEIAYALNHEDGALPWEFQYGVQYSPMVFGKRGAPFVAVNGHTREDFDYSTSINIVGGWQWRSTQSNRTFRVGGQYYDGPALQWSFVNKHETLKGFGIWFDY